MRDAMLLIIVINTDDLYTVLYYKPEALTHVYQYVFKELIENMMASPYSDVFIEKFRSLKQYTPFF
jgi:CRISPR/Cas system-associated protein Cas7 (RAMP superfamily)